MPIAQDGFLYTYLSCEGGGGSSNAAASTPAASSASAVGLAASNGVPANGPAVSNGTPVYFDDFTVEQLSYIVAVNDLYPFGASHDQERSVGLNNKYRYQGKELVADLGLLLYDFHARQMDPLLGRFLSVDPASQFASPYLAMGNNPVSMIDPDGQFAFVPILIIAAKAAAIGAGLGAAGYTASVGFSDGGFSNWDWGQFGTSAAIGAVSGVVTAGIGTAFGAVGGGASSFGGKAAYEGLRAATHGLAGLGINAAFGQEVNGASFAAGAFGSLVGSGLSGFSTAAQIGGSALSGGIGAELTGGDFFRGAAVGATVAGLNHAMHRGFSQGGDDPHYSYNGKDDLTATELYFEIMKDVAAEQLGIKDAAALLGVLAGEQFIPKRFTTPGATKNTSVASKYLSKIPGKSPVPLPTLVRSPGFRIGLRFTTSFGRFAARTIPVVGWGILAYDAGSILYKTQVRYNQITGQ